MDPEHSEASTIEAARQHYSDTLEYHNWNHAQALIDGVDDFAERLEARGLAISAPLLKIAAAWHDAGFSEDHMKLGFATKEHYSAHLMRQHLTGVLSQNEVDNIEAAILGTIHGADRESLDTLVLHRLDIANLGADYDYFHTSNIHLWHENKVTTGQDLNWEQWSTGTKKFVEFAIAEAIRELPRLGEPVGVMGAFDVNARKNLEKILNESGDVS